MTSSDLDAFDVDRATPEGTGPYQWFGHGSLRALRVRLEEKGLIDTSGGMLSVVVPDGAVAGWIKWMTHDWGPPSTSSCWTLAIGVRPEYRGRGIGTAAQRQAAAYLFAHTTRVRVQAFTGANNVAERTALERAGFTLEGTLRSAQWRDGAYHDQVLYSILRP